MRDKTDAARDAITYGRATLRALGMLLESQRINALDTKIKRADGAEITLYELARLNSLALYKLEKECDYE